MDLDAVYSRFGQVSPLPVMARVALEHATSDDFLDGIFAEHADRQVASELLFSTLVGLMTTVACRIRPSINAAFQQNSAKIGVSLQAV